MLRKMKKRKKYKIEVDERKNISVNRVVRGKDVPVGCVPPPPPPPKYHNREITNKAKLELEMSLIDFIYSTQLVKILCPLVELHHT